MKSPVFMYHALAIDGIAPKKADLHYSISFDTFKKQVEICKNNDFKISSLLGFLKDPNQYINHKFCFFTFDDGHISNYQAAVLLAENGFSADFFVNTSMLDKPHFLSREQLKNMHNMGMSIQTHGHEHKYFSELLPLELTEQFSSSRESIKSLIGADVSIFAPPGGRINREVVQAAKNAGIILISTSRPGLFTVTGNRYDVPRLPILHSTDSKKFLQLLTNSNHVILKLRLKHFVAKLLKRMLGNHAYEKFRLVVLKNHD